MLWTNKSYNNCNVTDAINKKNEESSLNWLMIEVHLSDIYIDIYHIYGNKGKYMTYYSNSIFSRGKKAIFAHNLYTIF